jgi:hypothetical protein
LRKKQLTLAISRNGTENESMAKPSTRELHALRNLISEADLILETAPALPQHRTTAARDLLRSAIALVEDFIEQSALSPAAVLGRKGGSITSLKHGPEHYRKMAARRKVHGGGRPRKPNQQ